MFRQSDFLRPALLGLLFAAVPLAGQTPAAGRGGAPPKFPERPQADPQMLARGKTLFEANCASCHAKDMRGSDRGINLVRDKLVLDDQAGELIGPFVSETHAAGGAPKMTWTPDQLHDVATFMHSFQNYRTIMMPVPESAILVGNAAAGRTYFQAKCVACHSVDGSPSKADSLEGIGSRITVVKTMQNAIVSGNGGGRGGRGGRAGRGAAAGADNPRTVTAVLTWPNGKKVEGTVVERDEFLITLRDAEGIATSYPRAGDVPKVELHDPMEAHRDLLRVYTDKDIHDLTAYLVTLK